ncbi:signal peptidase I [Acholeplasma vituli]|uniref:Signal peptidase I n=1 Tax=Paracholeplasma vituli TaxID=69473 RepID=A0ABT2PVC2_9MOLU|nr:signal peptidase I [Paracholeplasma vituli]MCU0104780.1 signal peptidase I [Paracholeplasma vituli]
MTLKELNKRIQNDPDSIDIKTELNRRMTLKGATLNVVSLLIFGVSLIYTIKAYPTFTEFFQKVLLLVLSGLLVVVSALFLFFLKKGLKGDNKVLYKQFKLIDTIQFFSISLMIVLHIITFYVFTAEVFQSSMQPTLQEHDRLIVYQFDYTPRRNDIVVIYIDETYYENLDEAHYVKRVIGLPGDTLVLNASNQLIVNGKIVQEVPSTYRTFVNELIDSLEGGVIPEGFYFVLGDNVQNSQDSRTLGLIRVQDIKAKVIFRFFPKVGIID